MFWFSDDATYGDYFRRNHNALAHGSYTAYTPGIKAKANLISRLGYEAHGSLSINSDHDTDFGPVGALNSVHM
ncbi:uncharacterized protein N7483_005951 [Penicillium malachiteum]|uniref:uncharacterized protein n=1 Tax=Penicillium malachiteum TaxID=1324776 RepID=UPI002548D3C3|nr:uncharacterized protein N7483_005951 [Penicillium malachiteum]KAJ5731443.1 hypothetical protein N7483_005951 [Penicillium malachiteum]